MASISKGGVDQVEIISTRMVQRVVGQAMRLFNISYAMCDGGMIGYATSIGTPEDGSEGEPTS